MTLRDMLQRTSDGWRELAKINGHDPETYPQCERYVLEHGRAYESHALMPAELADVLALVGRGKFPVKECFSNSQSVIVRHPFERSLTYVEGYVVNHRLPLPILHGWLDYNGSVIDLTCRTDPPYARRRRFRDRVLGEFEGREYFGIPYTSPHVRKFVCETHTLGSLLQCEWSGNPFMRVARPAGLSAPPRAPEARA